MDMKNLSSAISTKIVNFVSVTTPGKLSNADHWIKFWITNRKMKTIIYIVETNERIRDITIIKLKGNKSFTKK